MNRPATQPVPSTVGFDKHSATLSTAVYCTSETLAATFPVFNCNDPGGCLSALSSASHSDTLSATDNRLSVNPSGVVHSSVVSYSHR